MRCANCGHQWHQRPPIDFPQMIEPEPPPAAPLGRGARDSSANLPGFPRRARQPGAAIAWSALALALLLLVGAAVVARDAIVTAWPPAGRLYAAVGLAAEPPGSGLEFRNVTTARRLESDREVVVIEGEVVNVSNRDRQVPPLRAALTSDDHELTHWTFEATQSRLLPGESARFVTRTDEPAEEATDIKLRFADGT